MLRLSLIFVCLSFSTQAFAKQNFIQNLVKPAKLHLAQAPSEKDLACLMFTSTEEAAALCIGNNNLTVEKVFTCAMAASTPVTEAICVASSISIEDAISCYENTPTVLEEQACFATINHSVEIDENSFELVLEAMIQGEVMYLESILGSGMPGYVFSENGQPLYLRQ